MNARSAQLIRSAQSGASSKPLPRWLAHLLLWRVSSPLWQEIVVGAALAALSILLRVALLGATYKITYVTFWPFVALAAPVGRPPMGFTIIAFTAAYVHAWQVPLASTEDYYELLIYVGSGVAIVLVNDALMRACASAQSDHKRGESFRASLVQSSNDAIITKSLDGVVTSWNPAAKRLFGYEASEIVGRPVTLLFPPERAEEELEILARIRRGELVEHFETVRLTKDGRSLDVSITISPIFGEDDMIVGASKILRDITKQKQTSDALRASEERLRCALEGANAGAWQRDYVEGVMEWSPRFFEMHGLDPNLQTPSCDLWYKSMFVEDTAQVKRGLTEAIDSGVSDYSGRYRVQTPDAETRWIEIFGRLFRDLQGGLHRSAGIAIDVTERHNVVEALTKSNADLERANENLKRFSSIAAHDLQEPLRKIEQFSDLFGKEFGAQVDSDGAFYLSIMQDSARRMRALINGLLAFSRAGNRPLTMAQIDMDKMMQRVLFNCSSAIEESRAQVRLSSLPPLIGDEGLVEHLFQNLLSNALKYAKSGVAPRIELVGRVEEQATTISVVDEGVGIAPEHHSVVFEPFTRLNPREKVKGAGIGLAFCRTVCERHDWRLTVASALGAGATFSITAPKNQEAPRNDI